MKTAHVRYSMFQGNHCLRCFHQVSIGSFVNCHLCLENNFYTFISILFILFFQYSPVEVFPILTLIHFIGHHLRSYFLVIESVWCVCMCELNYNHFGSQLCMNNRFVKCNFNKYKLFESFPYLAEFFPLWSTWRRYMKMPVCIWCSAHTHTHTIIAELVENDDSITIFHIWSFVLFSSSFWKSILHSKKHLTGIRIQ